MAKTRWGIIGPGGIAHNFADGLAEAQSGELVAIGSRSAERRKSFGDDYNIAPDKRYSTYEALVADGEIDAIYVSTPHPWHAELAIMAMRAGKPIVCEKPAGMTASQVEAMIEVAEQEGVFFMEAFMYRCHPQIARMLEIIAAGEIGALQHVRVNFGFNAAFNPDGRTYARELGGGAVLDVGCYPVSFARLIAGAAIGKGYDEPVEFKATGLMAPSDVDSVAYAVMKFSEGFTADIGTAVAMNMDNNARIFGTKGEIVVADPWVPGRNAGPSDSILTVTVEGETRVEEIKHPAHLFYFEAELASQLIAQGALQAQAPACSHGDSIGNNRVLDDWRHQVGYRVINEVAATNKVLPGVLPKGLPQIPTKRIDGLDAPVSSLIMGCDNRRTIADGAIVWDAYMEAGGTAFDTAYLYGGGLSEQVLGEWIAARGVQKEVTIIAKGGHTPYCTPRSLASQLAISQERQGLDYAAIYIMHRDNPEVPVGEFIDAMNRLRDAGRIGIFGGSNWSVERFAAANDYAAAHGLEPMRILNNNLSLAVMEKPVWTGCVTSNNEATLGFLREKDVAHFAWSSQARGYFLPEAVRGQLPDDIGPEACFGSAQNGERRKRAETLAQQHGVSAHNIATAWVLAQTFPSFALIGPRTAGELASTLPALGVTLSGSEVAWLNLEADSV